MKSIIFAVTLISLVNVQLITAGDRLSKIVTKFVGGMSPEYKRINKFLETTLPIEFDADKNLATVSKELENNMASIKTKDVEAWQTFNDLGHISSGSECSDENVATLVHNVKRAGLNLSSHEPHDARVELVIIEKANLLSKKCEKTLEEDYTRVAKAFKSADMDFANALGISMCEAYGYYRLRDFFDPLGQEIKSLRKHVKKDHNMKIMHAIERTLLGGQTYQVGVVYKGDEKYKKLVSHLPVMCQSYVDNFGSIHDKAQNLVEANPKLVVSIDFARSWINYIICDSLMQRDQKELKNQIDTFPY